MTQLVLPLHECAAKPFHAAADPAATESMAEPLHSAADPATAGAAPTETSCYVFEFQSLVII
jgi:hypothetical protein